MKTRILMAILIGIAISMGSGIPAEAKGKGIVVKALIDCEDVDTLTVPCVTFDEGKWRMVTDYSPYKSKVLKKCKTFTYKNAPCVKTKKTKSNKYWVALRK